MKPAVSKKKSNEVKGFGFADAMFGIKDIAMEYQDLQGGSITANNAGKVHTFNNKVNTKMTVVKKQQIAPKKIQNAPLEKKIQIIKQSNKQTFKVSAGKQFEDFATADLIPIQTNENVYELTINGLKTNLQDGAVCEGISIKEIVPNFQVNFNFSCSDVRQGGLGNCYFISTLASLAHLPKILQQRIPKFKTYTAASQKFEVNLFQSGKNIKIIVDDAFPKIFAKPVGNDISLMILQKAYAHVFGSFDTLNMGHSCDSLRDMTGAPSEYVDLKDKTELIAKIKQIFSQKYPIVIASKANVKIPSISPKHSFNILDYKVKQNDLYLKIRDPRGNYLKLESPIQISQEQSSNGMFWVNHKTLLQNFQVITISKAKQGYKYFFKIFKAKELTNNQACILIKSKQKAVFTFTCHQKHKKFFDQKFSYQMLRILLARINRENGKIIPIQIIKSDFKVQQVCYITVQLEKGEYILFGKVGNGKPKSQSQALTMSIYSSIFQPSSLQFEVVKGNITVQPFIQQYIRNNKSQFKESVSQQKLCRYFGAFYGYMCVYFENKSGKAVIEDIDYSTENITITQKKVSLKSGQTKLLLHPIGQSNNCSHKFAFKTKTIYKGS